jgi:hypothetical protein
MKKCKECLEEKPIECFYKHKGNTDGYKHKCKVCYNTQVKDVYLKNPERKRSMNKAHYYNNKSYYVAKCAKYRAAKLKRTPKWLNSEQLACIEKEYSMAKKLEAITGDKYHVDHIIPLQGKFVSGLHVPWNLQVIEASENKSKGNSYEM